MPTMIRDEPPPGAPWDDAPAHAARVFFDLEMTGLDPEHDAIVEVAFIRVEPGADAPVEDFATTVATDGGSAPAALAVHGISDVARRDAPTFQSIAPRVEALLRGAVPIGHGTALDVRFLSRALAAAGRDASVLDHVIDTTTLARRAVASPRYTLETLAGVLALPPRGWHRAREDALGVRALFERVAPEFAPVSMRDLWQVRVGQRDPVRVRDAIDAALTERAATRAPCSLVVRSAGRAPFRVRGVVERWSRPHVLVLPLGGRAGSVARLVRADRILRIEPYAPP